jgi:phosphohistidine phosphatase
MKTLILIRHAKSSWENNLPDKLRPLLPKGLLGIEKVAKACVEFLPKNFVIFSSDAVRTRETARVFCRTINYNFQEIDFTDALYTFEYYDLIKFIKKIDDVCNNIIIFGHNFALTDFINQHSDYELDNLPTSGFVKLEFDVENWQNIKKGVLKQKIIPKEL